MAPEGPLYPCEYRSGVDLRAFPRRPRADITDPVRSVDLIGGDRLQTRRYNPTACRLNRRCGTVETRFEARMHGLETELSAHHIANLLFHLEKPRSVVDVCCDTGTFLSQQDQPVVTAVLGLDGEPA